MNIGSGLSKTSQRSAAHGGTKYQFVLSGGVYAGQNTLRDANAEFVRSGLGVHLNAEAA